MARTVAVHRHQIYLTPDWSVAINICIHFTVQLIHDIPSSDDGTCQPEVTFVNVCRHASQTGLTERTSSARSESGENFDRAT